MRHTKIPYSAMSCAFQSNRVGSVIETDDETKACERFGGAADAESACGHDEERDQGSSARGFYF